MITYLFSITNMALATSSEGLLNLVLQNAEKLSIITILVMLVVSMGGLLVYMFKYFNKQLGERDKTIKEMTAVLLESNEVITKLMNVVDDNRKDILSELRIMANDIKTHITMSILGESRNGNIRKKD